MQPFASFLLRGLACLALGLGAETVQGAIANGAPHLVPGDSSSASSGELFLNVWDETAAKSYSLDLGLTVEALLANPAAQSWNLDQRFKDFAAAGNPLQFNIAANNTYGGIAASALGTVPSTYGVLSSVLNASADIAAAQARTGRAGTEVQQLSSPVQARVNALNLSAAAQNGLTPGNAADMTDFAANLGETTDGNNDLYSAYFATLWGNNLSNRFAFSTTATVRGGEGAADQSLLLYFFGLQGPGVNKLQATELTGSALQVTLDPATAILKLGAGSGGSTDPGEHKACEQLAWAGAVPDGGSITAYSLAKSADCAAAAKTLTCANGVLDGSDVYKLPDCADTGCVLPDTLGGGKLASGQSVAAYAAQFSANCAAETRTCNEGTLSGSYPYANCQAPAACVLPWGGTLADGQSVTAYRRAVDNNCDSGVEPRTCTNGHLSGSAAHPACVPPDFGTGAPCALPWGDSLADGQSAVAYSATASADCAAASEIRFCVDGGLSGSFANPACTAVVAPDEPYIQVLFPKGGETFTVGQKLTVRWDYALIPKGKPVKLFLSKNNGETWKLLRSGIKIGQGRAAWKAKPNQVTAAGLLRVCVPKSKPSAMVCGYSEAEFSISR